jgi:hypothetical protein
MGLNYLKELGHLMKNTILLCIVGIFIAANSHAQTFLTNGLVAYYPFNGNANDEVGTNDGTVFAATLTSDRFGNPNHAYSFNGTNSYIQCPDTGLPSGNAPRTVTFWMNVSDFANTYPFSYGMDGATNAFFAYVNTSSRIAVGKSGGGDTPSRAISGNVWLHIAITYSNSICTLYVNGANPAQAVRYYGTTLAGNFYIGRYLGGFPPTFYGVIDDVRVYNRALSSQEVSSLYQYESQTTIALIKAVKPMFSNLYIGTNYQLQVSADLSAWTNQGSPFIATNSTMIYPQYFDVDNWNQHFFRLQISP